jgi:predicted ATPase
MVVRRQPARYRRVVQYELNKVTLNNFRSINNQEISIKPLTIVVGGNSAGKSSLLKAVLLMAQAQREKNVPGQIALNGLWVRLEQFKSVVHGGDLNNQIRIGLTFSVNQERRLMTPDLVIHTRSQSVSDWALMSLNDLKDELTYEIELGATDRNKGVAEVNSCRFESSGGSISISRSDVDKLNVLGASGALPFDGEFEFSSRDEVDRADVTGAVLSGAVVTHCAVERPMIEELLEEIVRKLSRPPFPSSFFRGEKSNQRRIDKGDEDELIRVEQSLTEEDPHLSTSDNITDYIMAMLVRRRLIADGAKSVLDQIQEADVVSVASQYMRDLVLSAVELCTLILTEKDRFPRLSILLLETIEKILDKDAAHFPSNPKADREKIVMLFVNRRFAGLDVYLDQLVRQIVESDALWATKISVISFKHEVAGASALDEYLMRSIHFLGPLRVAPSSAADYSRRGSDRGVGPEGQHLAYQLMMNPTVSGFRWVENSEERRGVSVSTEEVSLAEAMTYWVRELNLATAVRAEEIPGVGDSIRLSVRGVSSELSPNDVGVGVSQALPVIGAVLLANPGDLVVLEQPELHLHPDAQLELAEFFVAAMKSGRRLLIESHSEHFLNKLRLMAASADDEVAKELTDMVGFVFAERLDDGLSQFREVKLTSDGSVQDWPKGFFDQGTNAAKELFLLRQKRSRD